MGLSGRALQVSPELGGEPERKIHSGIILSRCHITKISGSCYTG